MKEMTFEEKLKQLEEITNTLENEKKGLKESIELYEKAKVLAASLNKELEEAANKVAFIVEENEKKVYEPEKDKNE